MGEHRSLFGGVAVGKKNFGTHKFSFELAKGAVAKDFPRHGRSRYWDGESGGRSI